MSPTDNERTGGCLCGAVRYRATGAPNWVAHCHCTSCRRNTGSAFTTYAGFPQANFAWTKGTTQSFASSPGVKRSFCAACGTPMTFEGARWPGEVHVLVGTLDAPQGLAPQAHVNMSEAMPWVHLADNLPRFATIAAEKSSA